MSHILANFSKVQLERRAFLKGSGALVVAFSFPLAATGKAEPAIFGPVPPEQLDSWLAVANDGTVSVYTGRIEMGTGASTVYVQAVAEELDVGVDAITILMGDTARTPEQSKSTASDSITLNLPPLRQAAAEARLKLLELASEQLNISVEGLATANGVITPQGQTAPSIRYGDLIGGKRFDLVLGVTGSGNQTALSGRAKRKDAHDLKILGTSIPRIDIPSKARGEFVFVHDIVLDGMLHGTVVLPPARGAKLASIEGFPRPIPGIVKVVSKVNFVGIVAETEQAAVQARNEIKVNWSTPEGAPDMTDVPNAIHAAPIVKDMDERKDGDAEGAIEKAAKVYEASFELPFNTHGMMGPSCVVADLRDGALTLWSGTQWPDGTRRDVASMLGIAPENVRLIWVEGAGSYGRLGVDDAAGDAALLSQAVGRPVRVQWQRADEHGWSPFNPGASIKIRVGTDSSGNIIAWHYQNWSPSHSTGERGNILAWRSLGTNPDYARLSGGADAPSYSIPNLHVVSHYTKELIRAVYMRSVGGIQNTFAIESMMDDLAAAAGVDPVTYRLKHIVNERTKGVLEAAAKKANWSTTPRKGGSGSILTGRGIALVGSSAASSSSSTSAYIATVADVEVNKESGEVRVKHVYVAFDAGQVMNPDGLHNQIEGGTLMGISRALKEEVKFSGSAVTTTDWAAYPILRFTEIPDAIEIELINSFNPPLGAGEPPNVTPAAAIGNAIFAATGKRIRSLPLTPEKVRAALAS